MLTIQGGYAIISRLTMRQQDTPGLPGKLMRV